MDKTQLWNKTRTLLEMIKFSHTIFAFPFALMGVVLASLANGQAPGFGQVSGSVSPWSEREPQLWASTA